MNTHGHELDDYINELYQEKTILGAELIRRERQSDHNKDWLALSLLNLGTPIASLVLSHSLFPQMGEEARLVLAGAQTLFGYALLGISHLRIKRSINDDFERRVTRVAKSLPTLKPIDPKKVVERAQWEGR